MGSRIVKVPDAGDCFFHVVAFFLGAKADDVGAARRVRRQLAALAAKSLFKPPYDDLSTLTSLVMHSKKGADLNVVKDADGIVAHNLRNWFQHGVAGDGGNGGHAPLAAFVVWMQFDTTEIAKLSKKNLVPWAALAFNFLKYTIWGDGAFAVSLARRRYERNVEIYNAHSRDQVTTNDGVINLYHKNGNHFDALLFEEDEEDDLDALDTTSIPVPDVDNLTLEIHHIDVGQGDSTLIVVRHRRKIIQSVLIDAGDKGQAPIVHEHMRRVGLVNLDTMVVTHYDKDHFRGIVALARHSKICQRAKIFDRGDPEDYDLELKVGKLTDSHEDIEDERIYDDEIEELNELLRGKTSKQRMTKGKSSKQILGSWLMRIGRPKQPPVLTLQCVAAGGFVLGGTYVRPLHSDRENAMSLAFLLRFGSFAYLLGGDAPGVEACDVEGAIGKYVISKLGLAHVCALRTSHHGSHHSTTAPFVQRIAPTCAFVSAGINGKFRHPRQQPIDNLASQGTVQGVYFTRCAYRRKGITKHGSIQTGVMRVAGDEKTLGTIVLTIEHAAVMAHVFYVGYWDRELGEWRTERHCCTKPKLQKEITPPSSTFDDLLWSCDSSDKSALEIEDDIQIERSKSHAEVVRGVGVRRDARRSVIDPGKGGSRPKKKAKTEETKEMVEELDEKYDRMIEDMVVDQEEDDSDYDPEGG